MSRDWSNPLVTRHCVDIRQDLDYAREYILERSSLAMPIIPAIASCTWFSILHVETLQFDMESLVGLLHWVPIMPFTLKATSLSQALTLIRAQEPT
jgi:hypothetical protein